MLSHPDTIAGLPEAEFETILQHGTLLRFRRRQKLSIPTSDEPLLYLVQKGALFIELEIEDGRRQILLLLLAGDTFDTQLSPDCRQCRLIAAGSAEVIRLRPAGIVAIQSEAPATATALTGRTASLLAMTLLMHASIGRLNGDERVASYLLELGARTGGLANADAAIDMPLARKDIADYLALNADTLSRIMTRLRARGAIGRSSRGKLAIRSWAKLREMSPLANVIAPRLAD